MLLSIIIPCYNSARFIATTLDMLIAQDISNCEVIIINDGSIDNTKEIVLNYSKFNSNIRLIDKKNEGVSIARNAGIEQAKGDYIYFLDSDDSLEENTLIFFKKAIKENPLNNFFGFGYKSEYNGKLIKNYASKKFDKYQFNNSFVQQIFFSKKLCFHICSCIYKKTFLIQNDIQFTPGLRIGEDVEFLLNILRLTPDCVYYSRNCYIYKIRDDSTMQGYKTFSKDHLNSYIIRKNICLLNEFQSTKIARYCNFWLINQLISHLIMYLKSNTKDDEITDSFIKELQLLSLPITYKVAKKNLIIILISRILPIKLILKILK